MLTIRFSINDAVKRAVDYPNLKMTLPFNSVDDVAIDVNVTISH